MKIPELGAATLFEAARALVSAGTTLYLTWKGQARWEPKIDIPQLPQRIVGLLSAVLLAWSSLDPRWAHDVDRLQKSLIVLCSLCVVAALLYLFITATNVYYTKLGNRKTRIIGGFHLTPSARAELKKRKTKLTVQNYLLKNAGSDPDRVWSRPSRAGMQVLFVACYITLSVAGTGALSFAAQAYVNRRVAPNHGETTTRKQAQKPTAKPASQPTGDKSAPSPTTASPTPEKPRPPY